MQLAQWNNSWKYEEKQTMRGAPETSFEEVRIGAVDGRGKSSEMWGGETTQWTGEPNGPVGEVGLNELGPTNVEDMKHNENDITKQIEIAKNGDKKTCNRGSRQYLECCERVIVHQSGSEVKYQQKQSYHENKSHDLGINGKKCVTIFDT